MRFWSGKRTRTTGIGNGVAIPHGKCVGYAEPDYGGRQAGDAD